MTVRLFQKVQMRANCTLISPEVGFAGFTHPSTVTNMDRQILYRRNGLRFAWGWTGYPSARTDTTMVSSPSLL